MENIKSVVKALVLADVVNQIPICRAVAFVATALFLLYGWRGTLLLRVKGRREVSTSSFFVFVFCQEFAQGTL